MAELENLFVVAFCLKYNTIQYNKVNFSNATLNYNFKTFENYEPEVKNILAANKQWEKMLSMSNGLEC